MSPQVQAYCFRSIIRYFNGDWDLFLQYVKKAKEIYDKENHLWVCIGDLLKERGTKECSR